jgi:hypothetical protein
MIIVHPHHIIVLNISRDSLGEQEIGLIVRVPRRFVKGNLARVVVKQWPQNGVCRLAPGKTAFLPRELT